MATNIPINSHWKAIQDFNLRIGDTLKIDWGMGFNTPATSYDATGRDSQGNSWVMSAGSPHSETFIYKGHYRFDVNYVFVGAGSGQPSVRLTVNGSIVPLFAPNGSNYIPPTHPSTRHASFVIDGGQPDTPTYLEELAKLDQYSKAQYIPDGHQMP